MAAGRIPGVSAAAKKKPRRKAPAKHTSQIPAVSGAAKPKQAAHREAARAQGPKQHQSQVPAVSGAKQPALARHREKARTEGEAGVRTPKRGGNQVPGLSTIYNPHLAAHRANRKTQEDYGQRIMGAVRSGELPKLSPTKPGPYAGLRGTGTAKTHDNPWSGDMTIDTNSPEDVIDTGLTVALGGPGMVGSGHKLGDELRGTGFTAEAAKRAKDFIAGAIPTSAPGGETAGRPSMQTADLGAALGRSLKVGVAGAKDVVDIPANTLPSVYGAIKDPGATWRGFKSTDPIALAFQGKWDKALKQAAEHPVATGLEVSGGYGAVGRAPTLAARTGVAGRGARAWSLGAREAQKIPGYHVGVPRRYSPNVVTRLAQQRADRKAGLARTVAHPIRTERANARKLLDDAAAGKRSGHRAGPDPNIAAPWRQNRELGLRGDEFENTINEGTRRTHRTSTAKRVFRTIFPTRGARAGRAAGDALRGGYEYRAAVERIARKPETLLQDLKSYRDDLEVQWKRLRQESPDAALLNHQLRDHIGAAITRIEKGKVDPAQVFEAANRYIEDTKPLQEELVKQGLLDPVAEREAKLIPYAVRHKGAAYSRLPRLTRTGAMVRKAAGDVRETRKRLETTRQQLAQAREQVRFEAGRKRQLGANATPRQREAAQLRLQRAIDKRNRIKDYVTRHQDDVKLTDAAFRAAKGNRRAAGESMTAKPGMVVPTDTVPEALRGITPEQLRAMRREERGIANNPDVTATERSAARKRIDELRHAELQWRALDPAEIEAEMAAGGDSSIGAPGFLTQRPGGWDSRAYHIPSVEPHQLDRTGRTGEATRLGTYSGEGVRSMVEEALHSQASVDAIDAYRKRIGLFGVRNPEGGGIWRSASNQTRGAFERAVHDHEARHGHPRDYFRVVREVPQAATRLQSDLARMHTDAHADAGNYGNVDPADVAAAEMIRTALSGGGEASEVGPFVVIPSEVAKRAVNHLEVAGASGPKAFQKFVNLWRTNVLVFSPKWATGNVVEAGLRSAVAGAGPRSYMTGKRIRERRREIAPEKAADIEHLAEGGNLLYGSATRELYRGARAWEGSVLGPLAKSLEQFWRRPTPATLARLYHGYANGVKVSMRQVEQQFQIAAAGKYALSHQIDEPYFLRVSDRAIQEAAVGQLATEAQFEMARFVRKVFGNYEVFPPVVRGIFAAYTPFAPWYLNALRFLFHTLPRDHPVLTGLIAASYQETEDWRKKYGLSLFGSPRMDPYLQGGIPDSGGIRRIQHYTPFGAVAEGAEGAAGLVLPQGVNTWYAFQGRDWRGEEITQNGQKIDTLTSIALGLADALSTGIPGVVPAQQILQEGGVPQGVPWPVFGDVKDKGGLAAGLARWANPVRESGGPPGERMQRARYNQLADQKHGALTEIRHAKPNTYHDSPKYRRLNDERKRLEDKLGITAKRKKGRQRAGGGSGSASPWGGSDGGGSSSSSPSAGQENPWGGAKDRKSLEVDVPGERWASGAPVDAPKAPPPLVPSLPATGKTSSHVTPAKPDVVDPLAGAAIPYGARDPRAVGPVHNAVPRRGWAGGQGPEPHPRLGRRRRRRKAS